MRKFVFPLAIVALAVSFTAVAQTAKADWLAVGVICQRPEDAARANDELEKQVNIIKALPFLTECHCAMPDKKPKVVWIKRGYKKKGWLRDTVDKSVIHVKLMIEGKRTLVHGWTGCKWIINTETGGSLCGHSGSLFKAWGE